MVGRDNPSFLVTINAEFKEYSTYEGGYTDNYYMQMTQNIEDIKGTPIPEQKINQIDIDEFSD